MDNSGIPTFELGNIEGVKFTKVFGNYLVFDLRLNVSIRIFENFTLTSEDGCTIYLNIEITYLNDLQRLASTMSPPPVVSNTTRRDFQICIYDQEISFTVNTYNFIFSASFSVISGRIYSITAFPSLSKMKYNYVIFYDVFNNSSNQRTISFDKFHNIPGIGDLALALLTECWNSVLL